MTGRIEVLIGIQARSNSTRFPKKIFEFIGKKRVLEHVIDRARSAAVHVTRYPEDRNLKCHVAILHPHDDKELINTFRSNDCMLIGGSEEDVLSRFVEAQRIVNADYVARLTSDCPLVLDFMITKCINMAIFKNKDYVSNIEEECRTVADGFDVEVMSADALDWLHKNANTHEFREHVTLALRRLRPRTLEQGVIMAKLDTSHMKLSVDTPEDLEYIREFYHSSEFKRMRAEHLFGEKNVYWL